MPPNDVPATFVTYAAGILGDSASGLSGSKLVEITTSHTVERDAQLPHSQYPFKKPGINKRTALAENIMAFSTKGRYEVIKSMCVMLLDSPVISPSHKSKVQELKVRLSTKYGHLDEAGNAEAINQTLVEQTIHWLEPYPEVLELFNSALQKQDHGIFLRNLLDDLRLSLEKLLQGLLTNSKSLENQLILLGPLLKSKGGSPELTNMFQKLLEYYAKYQNTYVKHDDAVIEEEIELVFEITASFMKHLVRLSTR